MSAVLMFSSCAPSKMTKQLFAMDTVMQLTLYGGGEKDIESLQSIIETCENNYSFSRQGSLVARLNGGEGVEGDDGLLKMLDMAEKMRLATGGAYDITVAPILIAYGFGAEHNVPSESELKELLENVGEGRIKISDGIISLSNGAEIDLGSCAKGYTADRAIEYLKKSGVSCGILSLGGSIHTYGQKPDGSPFKIEITDPENPSETFAVIEAGECAIVTSGTYQRFFDMDGVRYHHLIDARTGRPSESDILSVTVIVDYSSPDAGMKADFLSTAMFLLGSEGALEYRSQNGGFEMVITKNNGEITVTDGLKDKIQLK